MRKWLKWFAFMIAAAALVAFMGCSRAGPAAISPTPSPSRGPNPGPATAPGEWTWVSGPNSVNQPESYGTSGVADPDNVPGAPQEAVSWSDAEGNSWSWDVTLPGAFLPSMGARLGKVRPPCSHFPLDKLSDPW